MPLARGPLVETERGVGAASFASSSISAEAGLLMASHVESAPELSRDSSGYELLRTPLIPTSADSSEPLPPKADLGAALSPSAAPAASPAAALPSGEEEDVTIELPASPVELRKSALAHEAQKMPEAAATPSHSGDTAWIPHKGEDDLAA